MSANNKRLAPVIPIRPGVVIEQAFQVNAKAYRPPSFDALFDADAQAQERKDDFHAAAAHITGALNQLEAYRDEPKVLALMTDMAGIRTRLQMVSNPPPKRTPPKRYA